MAVQFGTQLTRKTSLEQVQRRSARFVCNDYKNLSPDCVTNMVKTLEWERLQDRRKTNRLCMLYKIQNNFIDIDKNQYLTSSRTIGQHKFDQEKTTSAQFSRKSGSYTGRRRSYAFRSGIQQQIN